MSATETDQAAKEQMPTDATKLTQDSLPGMEYQDSSQHDYARGVAVIFKALQRIYGYKFRQAGLDDAARDLWMRYLEMHKISLSQISFGIMRTPTMRPEWPPTMGQFLGLIKTYATKAHRPGVPRLSQGRGDPEKASQAMSACRERLRAVVIREEIDEEQRAQELDEQKRRLLDACDKHYPGPSQNPWKTKPGGAQNDKIEKT